MASLKAIHAYGASGGLGTTGTNHTATVDLAANDYVFAWVTWRSGSSVASQDATLPAWFARVSDLTATSSGLQRMDGELWAGRAPSATSSLAFSVGGPSPFGVTCQTLVFSDVLDPDEEIAYGAVDGSPAYPGFALARPAFVMFTTLNCLYPFFSGITAGTLVDSDDIVYDSPNSTTASAMVRSFVAGDTGSFAFGSAISGGAAFGVAFRLYATPDVFPVVADAGDRLRSSVTETTGSLLEAVDARAVDASVSEAYTYAQELPATTLVTYREVLRERDSATADFAYYPQPRQNIAMENQYTGLTILGRLARYYPPRIYNDVVSLGLSGIPAATATDCINYVLTQWAADNDWLTFETVPDLRVPMPGLVPSDYGVGTGQVYASTIAIKQDGSNRRDALSILRDLLSPFPGTVVRQNSAGNLEIVPASGPDADETAFVTLDTKDLYSVTIGKPNEFDTINRCVVSSTGGAEQSTDVAVMQPAWFQLGSSYQFGRSNWYTPPGTRTNLQPFEHATNTTLQQGLTTSSNFNLQKPVLWPISGDAIPAGDGISLVSTGAVDQVTIAWARYFNDSLVSSGTNGLTITTDTIPFSGAWVDALSVSFSTGGESVFANIRMRWNETEQGIEIGLGTAKLETDCFTGCNGVIIEFVLADASTAYEEASPVTASFGFVGDDPDILPGVNSADAVLESQTALGIVERRIDIRGYVFDATTLYQIARGYVLNNITPKVTRELDVAALSGYRVLFDNIGRLHELPSGDVGFLTGVTYTDDFVSGIVRKTATVEVRDLAAAGAVDTTTDYLLMDDGSFWQNDDDSLSEAP